MLARVIRNQSQVVTSQAYKQKSWRTCRMRGTSLEVNPIDSEKNNTKGPTQDLQDTVDKEVQKKSTRGGRKRTNN
jgi:hypothetical protein